MTHPVPTENIPNLLRVMHLAFVQARNLALKGDCQQVFELAATFELVPELMAHGDESTFDRIRAILTEYDSSHPQSGYEYVTLLDEDSAPAFMSRANE